ncbi:MAG: aldehyde dehydrogenase [gamma proteobacterium symbiont of Ctena orbiculata]|nr:MAG: aldehyde dehydrogenase [gamma proteobacterium symbiont of Ctena orbiculata]
MKATEAIDQLNPQKWGQTNCSDRLQLLNQVRCNLKEYGGELAHADTEMKNGLMGEAHYNDAISGVSTVVPMATAINACIDLYESLKHGTMPKPISVNKVADGLYDIHVFPSHTRDKIIYSGRKDILRVMGEPRQVNPMEKTAGVIAVLGAGNYSSALEMVKAIFLENCAVVHKPHHLNDKTDRIWAKIMEPLAKHGVLSFCDADQGRELTADERLSKIYFTGGTATAKAIMNATDTELVSECGGNNPCIIVPGDRPWTEKEIAHQATHIITIAKLNGGAVCGRTQTIVTSKNWTQREAFLAALKKAIVEDTPAAGTYYPGSDEVTKSFLEAYPEAEILKPEGGKYKSADFMMITGVDEDSYSITHEAFCQIIDEVALDTPANAMGFLPRAVEFCNTRLLGTLGSAILIDEDTKSANQSVLDQAITDMEYGAVAVNTMPPMIFLNPYLTWGGNEEDKELVSGRGNFGNALCFENVEKSIIIDNFMSPGHMMMTNKGAFDTLATNMTRYAVEPDWTNLLRMMGGAIVSSFKGKDF